MHHLVVHGHRVGSSLAQVVVVSVEVAIGRVAAQMLVASVDGGDVLGAGPYHLLHGKLVIEVLYVFQRLLIVLLGVLIDSCPVHNGLLVVLVRA